MSTRGVQWYHSSVKIGLLVLAASVFAKSAAADLPHVSAKVSWAGECDDSSELAREMRARGVVLVEGAGGDSPVLELDVSVTTDASGGHSAALELRSGRGRQLRELQAQQCAELRRAVAWVLLVLAEERALAPGLTSDEQPKRATFPPVTSGPELARATEARAPRAEQTEDTIAPARVPTNERRARFRLGTAFVTGFGFAPRPALGPSIFVELQSSPKSLAVRVTLLQLETLPFERDDATITVERLALRSSVGSNALWEPLGVAVSAELGQLTGSGRGFELASGRDREPWLAFGLSAKLDIPVVPRLLVAEVGASLDYTPFRYSFHYRSGQELSRSDPVEGRAQAGLAARW